ncbi:hypothetical protein [Paenarthrobacter nitroguajacolicus]|uniref:hypothetical protein n=1 Tax=Paenarthrobacter nitroguajacolicus TaxID=211146 RepID=UPI0015B7BD0D|nr:hypothetical protein [Paenarthrobacter nitroguajacolicus]
MESDTLSTVLECIQAFIRLIPHIKPVIRHARALGERRERQRTARRRQRGGNIET